MKLKDLIPLLKKMSKSKDFYFLYHVPTLPKNIITIIIGVTYDNSK